MFADRGLFVPGLFGEPCFVRNQLERGRVPLPLKNLKKERDGLGARSHSGGRQKCGNRNLVHEGQSW